MSTQTETPEAGTDPFLTRWFMASAMLVLALAVGLGALLLHDPGTPGASPVPARAGCDLPASDQTDIVGVPTTGWVLVGESDAGMMVPSTADHGPAVRTGGGFHSCWAQSPLGAVSAATYFAALGSTGNEYTLYRDFTVDGSGRDRLLAETPEDTDPYGPSPVLEAFRLVDYTGDEAEVVVVMGDGVGNHVSAVFDIVYEDGDWRYDPPSSLEPEMSFPPNLDGYTEFKRGT